MESDNGTKPVVVEPGGDWIKLYRKVIKHPVFQDPRLFQTFIYCLCHAGYKEERILMNGQEYILAPGEFITGRKVASKELGMKGIMWDRKLQILENLQILNRKANNRFSIITIKNWNTYQKNTKEDEHIYEQQMNNKRTTNEHKQEYKEYKEIKNTTIAEYDSRSHSAILDILNSNRDLFYKAYPAINLDTEAAKAIAWLKANPKNRKANLKRFLTNWFSRAQERAPRAEATGRPLTLKEIIAREGL